MWKLPGPSNAVVAGQTVTFARTGVIGQPPATVGRIIDLRDCRWADVSSVVIKTRLDNGDMAVQQRVWADSAAPGQKGQAIVLGQALAINSGVVEIRYNIGVNVRLEGPAVFEVNGLNTGLLWFGKMTARVESPNAKDGVSGGEALSGRPTFIVRTPNAGGEPYVAALTGLGGAFFLDVDNHCAALVHTISSPVWMREPTDSGTLHPVYVGEDRSILIGVNSEGRSRVAVEMAPPKALAGRLPKGTPSYAVQKLRKSVRRGEN